MQNTEIRAVHSFVHSLTYVFAQHRYLSALYVQSCSDAAVAKQTSACSAGALIPVRKTDTTQVNKGTRQCLTAICAMRKTKLRECHGHIYTTKCKIDS